MLNFFRRRSQEHWDIFLLFGTCIQHATYTKDPLDQMSFSTKNVKLAQISQAYLGMQWATFKYIEHILWAFESPKSWLSINPIPLTHAN
jgi:hypothetical protein